MAEGVNMHRESMTERSADLVLQLCREEMRNRSPGSILWPRTARRCTELGAPGMTYSVIE